MCVGRSACVRDAECFKPSALPVVVGDSLGKGAGGAVAGIREADSPERFLEDDVLHRVLDISSDRVGSLGAVAPRNCDPHCVTSTR